MAINERLIHTAAEAAAAAGTGNQEEGLILHLDANDVDSYDGDGSVWYDITNHEFTPAVDPAENFNTVLYTGDDSNDRAITGVGFQPDLVWIKNRDSATSHMIYDSVRGAEGSGGDHLSSDTTGQAGGGVTSLFDSFDTDGFTIDKASSSRVNETGDDYVAWCFKAGGAAVSNTDGDNGGSDVTSSVSANNDLGFSIVKWTDINSSGTAYTVGHGLDVPPEMIITKETNDTGNWVVYAKGATTKDQYLILQSTGSVGSLTNVFGAAEPTASVFGQQSGTSGTAGKEMIAYCFASKRGVSKVGSYKGTSSSVKVYTGFQPAFVIIKKTNSSTNGNWSVFDNARISSGDTYGHLYPGDNYAENDRDGVIEFTADGFKINNATVGQINGSGDSFIYLAFAAKKPDSLTPSREDFTEGTVTSGSEIELKANDYSGSGDWLDSTSNDNDATISGATYTNDGNSDYFIFDGSNDYAEITATNTSPINFTDEVFTLEAWVNMDTFGTYEGIISKWNLNKYQFRLGLGSTSPYKNFEYVERTTSNVNATFTSSTTLEANRWYHLVVTRSASQVTMYIDGEQDFQSSATNDIRDEASSQLRIGHIQDGPYSFDGKIAQVRMYDSTLSASEVKANYDATKGLYQNADLKLDIGMDYNADPTTSDLATGSIINLQADEYESSDGSTWNNQGSHATDSTITGATHMTKFGTSFFRFDGSNDSVSTGINNAQNLAWTVEVWFRVPNDNSNHPIVSSITGSGSVNGFSITSKSDGSLAASFLSGEYNVTASNEWDIDVDHRDGKWHHLIMSWDGVSGNTLYRKFDGVSYNTVSSRAGTASSDQTLHLAKYGGLSTTGKLDIAEFRLYSSNLTESQMTANYNARKELYELAFDDKLDNHDVTFEGTSLMLQNEELGDWVDFDGSNDYASVPNISFNYRNGFTYEIWFRPHSNAQSYVCRPSGTGNVPALSWRNYSGWGLTAFHYTGSGGASVSYLDSNLSINKWYHAVYTADSSGGELYIDGVLTASSSTSTRDGSASGTFYIGNYSSSVGNNFDGDIGQFRLYKSKLTADEVMQNYRFTKKDYPNGFNGTLPTSVSPSFSADNFNFVRGGITSGDQVQFGSDFHTALKTTTEGTVTAWINVDVINGRHTIFGTGHTSDNNDWALFRTTNSRTLQFSINNAGTANGFYTTATANITTGSWIHVAMSVSEAGVGKMYINGVPQAITYQTGNTSQWFNDVSTNIATVGSFDRGSSGQYYDPFDGQISEVKVYSTVLTDGEISALYTAGR